MLSHKLVRTIQKKTELLGFLRILSGIYSALVGFARLLTRKKKLDCPVISVGNIVTGGTGKTPAVQKLVRMLAEAGYRSAVLSRGYGRRPSKQTKHSGIVSDGKTITLNSEESGDEPQLLARNLPDTPVIVGKNRFLTGTLAVNRYNSEVLILDDGYQYRALDRDLDIVLVNAASPFGNGYLLPRGHLREHKRALARADILLLTHTDYCDDIQHLKNNLKKINASAPIIESVHCPGLLYEIVSGKPILLKTLRGKNIFSVSSIGFPESFEKMLTGFGVNIVERFRFEDHHRYSQAEINDIENIAAEKGITTLLTTQKDAVRLEKLSCENFLVLKCELKITRGENILMSMLTDTIRQTGIR